MEEETRQKDAEGEGKDAKSRAEGLGIVVFGAVFVDVKGYPLSQYIPGGKNAGRVIQVHGGVSRNVAEDIANVELRPTFISNGVLKRRKPLKKMYI